MNSFDIHLFRVPRACVLGAALALWGLSHEAGVARGQGPREQQQLYNERREQERRELEDAARRQREGRWLSPGWRKTLRSSMLWQPKGHRPPLTY